MSTDNRTTLNACDANTGWTGDDGTPTARSGTAFAGLYYENGISLSFQHSDADEHTYYTDGTGWDLSDATVFLIVKDNQQDTIANGGQKYVLGDGTDRIGVETNGSDDPGVQLDSLFYGMVLDVTNRTSFTQHVFAGVAANLTTTAITQVGFGSFHLAKAQGAIDNVYLDRLSYIANDSAAFTINGGTAMTPETWSDFQGDDVTNGWGVCGNPFASQFQMNASFDIGDTTAVDSYFEMDGVQLYLFGQTYAATHFFWGLVSNSGQTNSLVINASQIISIAGTNGTPCDFNWNEANFNNIQVDGSLLVDIGNITLPAASATRWIRSTTINGPTSLTPNGMELTDCVLSCGTNTRADGLLILDNAGDSNDMVNIQFIDDGAGHAIEITAAGSYDFDNFTFSAGFTGTGTNAAVYNSSGGAVTINVQNGGDTPSVRNAAMSTTTINNAVAVRVEGVAEGTAVKVVANETVGTITTGDVILEGLANSSGVLERTDFNYEAAFNPSGLDVLVRARNQGIPTSALAYANLQVFGSAENYGTSTTAISITHGFTNVLADDVFIVVINVGNQSGITDNNGMEAFTGPTDVDGDASANNRVSVFYRIANDSTPQTTFDFTLGATDNFAIHAFHCRRLNTTGTFYDQAPSASNQNTTGAATSITAPTLALAADTLGFAVGAGDQSNAFSAPNNGFAGGQQNAATQQALSTGYKIFETADNTGTTTFSWTPSNDANAFHFSVNSENLITTDQTTAANSSTSDDMTLTPATPAVDDAYYWGHPEEAAGLKINISTASTDTSQTLAWEYWNGSAWTAFTGLTDGTNNFRNSGLNRVTWTAPGNWATTSVDGNGPYYYFRARVTAVGTAPDQALGRWSSLDVTRYLPIPPSGDLQRTITSTGLTATLSQAEDTISEF